ncbi:MAG: hydroxymethylbilane synthase [Euryarchaeota archaeon]|nr:hydroxymethylbilane synthase [Euryarchaeota archaeon]
MILRIGTRGSKLALAQTRMVAGMLRARFPELEFQEVIIKTKGDKILDAPLAKIGDKGLFVKEIDEALISGDVDMAVHSLKDVPTEIPPELDIVAIPEREDVRDALISRGGLTIDELPKGALMGTSSLLRRALLSNYRPDLRFRDLRGNVDTRIRKVRAGEYDAIIVAVAGLKRLGLQGHITQILPAEPFLPAAGQGAMAVVARRDFPGNRYLKILDDPKARNATAAERALLRRMGGGCQAPLGVLTFLNGELMLKGVLLSPDGKRRIYAEGAGRPEEAEAVGERVGDALLGKGGRAILEEVYGKAFI